MSETTPETTSPIPAAFKSWLKVAAAAVAAALLADGADLFDVSWGDLRSYVAIGLAAFLPLLITYLDPSDKRWGTGANDERK